MSQETELVLEALQQHLAVCGELLGLAQKEAEALRDAASFPASAIREERNGLLAQLEASARAVSQERERWQQGRIPGSPPEPEVDELAQRVLDAIMRVLVLDRENEQNLLRRGLLPARSLPAPEQSQPHFVTSLYQRHLPRS